MVKMYRNGYKITRVRKDELLKILNSFDKLSLLYVRDSDYNRTIPKDIWDSMMDFRRLLNAPLVEAVDTTDLKSVTFGCTGSSPVRGTKTTQGDSTITKE